MYLQKRLKNKWLFKLLYYSKLNFEYFTQASKIVSTATHPAGQVT